MKPYQRAILFLLLVPLHMVLYGTVFCRMWAWFIMPLWPAAPVLTLWPAMGLSYVIRLVTHDDGLKREQWGDKSLAEIVGISLGGPLVFWFFGWLVHLLVVA